ncbi:MAG: hypothetical protein WBL65_05125 [Bryobacteraceae bacterium]
MPQLMTQSEYARHRGKSRQYISRLLQRGILVLRGGKLDVSASDLVLDDKPAVDVDPPIAQPPTATTVAPPLPFARPSAGTMEQAGASFGQARVADMVYRAKLRKLEFETRQGKLIEAELVGQRWSGILVMLKDRVLGVPDKLAPEVAALTDERQVRDVLRREMHLLLKVLNQEVRYAR